MLGLSSAEKQKKQVRTHGVQIQKQLAGIKKDGSEVESKGSKREWDDSRLKSASRIRFKASGTTEEVMREVVRKDR